MGVGWQGVIYLRKMIGVGGDDEDDGVLVSVLIMHNDNMTLDFNYLQADTW